MKKLKICKTCGIGELHWEEFKGVQLSRRPNGWRLYDKNGIIHICEHKAKTNQSQKQQGKFYSI